MRAHQIHEVLLVDPDDELRAVRALHLQMHGVRVVGTGSAAATLQRLRAGFRPCVVLTDPRASGAAAWGLVDYLHTDSVLSLVPLVLVTHDPVDVMCAHWHGVGECLAIPVLPERWMAAIEGHCRRLGGVPASSAAIRSAAKVRRPVLRRGDPIDHVPADGGPSVLPRLRRLA
jgi:DNA-binding NtrC family response regulator